MLFLIIHIVLCIIFIICKMKSDGRNNFSTVVVVCLPVVGFLLWCVECIIVMLKRDNSKSLDLEKLKITDERYRRVEADESRSNAMIVPLEDAMIVNDTMLRRSLMLDILHKNPEEYLHLLEKASRSDDVEITHYATTTLSEIQREYEIKIQKCMRRYKKNPGDLENLKEYKDCLIKYTDSGLITGVVLLMQRRNLLDVLKALLEQEKTSKEDIYSYIETNMDVEDYSEAWRVLTQSENRCRDDLKYYQLAVRYYWETGNSEEIAKQLQKIMDRKVYLNKEGKAWFEFWNRG